MCKGLWVACVLLYMQPFFSHCTSMWTADQHKDTMLGVVDTRIKVPNFWITHYWLMCTITKWLPSDFEEYVLWQAYRPTTTILEIFGGRYLSPRAASPLKILSNLEQTRLLFPLITLPSHLERFQNLQPPAENFSTSAICGSPGQAPSTPITQSVEEFKTY